MSQEPTFWEDTWSFREIYPDVVAGVKLARRLGLEWYPMLDGDGEAYEVATGGFYKQSEVGLDIIEELARVVFGSRRSQLEPLGELVTIEACANGVVVRHPAHDRDGHEAHVFEDEGTQTGRARALVSALQQAFPELDIWGALGVKP